jgi:hypothetical protein
LGCKQETDENPGISAASNSVSRVSSTDWLQSGDIALITKNLNEFIYKQSQKSTQDRSLTDDMSVSDGFALIESAIHLQFQNDRSFVENHVLDSISISFEMSAEGVLKGESIHNAYQYLSEYIAQKLTPETVLYLVDLDEYSSGTEERSISANFTVYILMGTKGVPLPSCTPTEADNWFLADELGRCNGSSVGWDATERLSQLINFGHCRSRCDGNITILIASSLPFTYYQSPIGSLIWQKFPIVNSPIVKCHNRDEMRQIQMVLGDIIRILTPSFVIPGSGQTIKAKFSSIRVNDQTIQNSLGTNFVEYNGRIFYQYDVCTIVPGGD